MAGTILKAQDPLSYEVEMSDGRVARRHVDHIRLRTVPDTAQTTAGEDGVPPNPAQTQDVANGPLQTMIKEHQRCARGDLVESGGNQVVWTCSHAWGIVLPWTLGGVNR